MRHSLSISIGIIILASALIASARPENVDPNLWLEDVHGERALQWVHTENAKTVAVFEKDPRFNGLYKDALAILQSEDRIPSPFLFAGQVYNFWQDADHVRGIWRRTSMADYRNPNPSWQTILDLDALAKAEHANWVWWPGPSVCDLTHERRCMVELSDGGEDAVTAREFDVVNLRFVTNGFVLPRGKQRFAWEDEDHLLAVREWSPGELTASGYPFIVKRLKRGQDMNSAAEVFRGSNKDGGYGVDLATFVDGDGHRVSIIMRSLSTFETEYYRVTPKGVRKLGLPLKAQIRGLVSGKLIASLEQDWQPDSGTRVSQGSLVALDLAALSADPAHLKPELIYVPGPREALDDVFPTKSTLLVSTLENVNGRVYRYRLGKLGHWTRERLPLPDNSAIHSIYTHIRTDDAFVSVSGFLKPLSLVFADAQSGTLSNIKVLPSQFDASHDVVEQYEAASKDGTKVPYFVVRPRAMQFDGSNPTILDAYGGFSVPRTPSYSGIRGKLWLEKGGIYVLANIRGGGEFGPSWHEAGLKIHRQRVYDDFAAVAQDLFARKITSPRRLGIQGGSNGGLLMGVEMTQHPDYWNAVDIQVPLLDMMRYEQIAAGTSWVGEYGSVSVPEERAFLASISPYDNLKRGVDYPEPFVWTTTKDDRVGPQHARKFAARMAEYGIPYYFHENVEGGHGAGANLEERARIEAMEMVYFTRKLMD